MKPVTPSTRADAVADYRTSGDPCHVVAARHGIPRSTLSSWARRSHDVDNLGYYGGWETRGGVRYPLAPERRLA